MTLHPLHQWGYAAALIDSKVPPETFETMKIGETKIIGPGAG